MDVNPRILELASFNVTLFPGETLRLERDRVHEMTGGDRVWSGRIAGEPLSRATFAVRNGVLSGVIDRALNTGSVLYEISPNGRGGYVLLERDNSAPAAPHAESIEVPTPLGRVALPAAITPAGGVHIVDLMVVYTPASRVRYGAAGIEAKILTAVADANTTMANSVVPLRFSMVHLGEVAYVETGKMNDALMALTRTTDGIIDEVHTVRDAVGADIVVLIDEDTSSAGLSYLMSIPSSSFAANAFSVVYSGALPSLSMTHELGHVFGAHHDRARATGLAAFPYAYGWRVCDTNLPTFRTVMAYACGSAIRINYLSNPRLSYAGLPLGVDYDVDPANAADNARAITETAGIVAGFRASATPSAPATPTGLSLGGVTSDSVVLNWVDASTDETAFLVERSAGGGAFTLIATVGANGTCYVDGAVAEGAVYGYRVLAANSAGYSAASNTGTATVPVPAIVPNAPSSLVCKTVTRTSIAVGWTDNATNETGFHVERSLNGSTWTRVATLGANATSYNSTGLKSNTSYYFRVRAYNTSGSSAYTTTLTAKTLH